MAKTIPETEKLARCLVLQSPISQILFWLPIIPYYKTYKTGGLVIYGKQIGTPAVFLISLALPSCDGAYFATVNPPISRLAAQLDRLLFILLLQSIISLLERS